LVEIPRFTSVGSSIGLYDARGGFINRFLYKLLLIYQHLIKGEHLEYYF
jgi:hypothetical protein